MLTVLVVEDDDVVRGMIRDVLEMEGHTVRTAANGHAAVDELSTVRPDCVVLDVMMPGLDGFGVLEWIRAQEGLVDLPVVIVTAAQDDSTTWRSWQSGANYFLAKPIDFEALFAFLAALKPGRRRAPAPTSSPYEIVALSGEVGDTDERTLWTLVRALESQAMTLGAPALVMHSVTASEHAEPPRTALLETLAERGVDVVLLGPRVPRTNGGNGTLATVPLRPDDRLEYEWVHVVVSPRAVTCLAARRGMEDGRWAFVLTSDIPAVASAAQALLDRVPHLRLTMPSLPAAALPEPATAPSAYEITSA